MKPDDLVARSRWEGARRRALAEGRPLPAEPAEARPGPRAPSAASADAYPASALLATAGPTTAAPVDAARADASRADAERGADAVTAPESPPVATGPWFDRRGFFLGWAAMIVGAIAIQNAFAAGVAGFAVAYLASRRQRLVNAVASVIGGYVAGTVAAILLFLIVLVVAR